MAERKTCRHCGKVIWLAQVGTHRIWVAGPLWDDELACLPGKAHAPELEVVS